MNVSGAANDREPERGQYPVVFTQHVLFGDLDVLGHLNNGALARMFKEGRARANRVVFGPCDAVPPPRRTAASPVPHIDHSEGVGSWHQTTAARLATSTTWS